jgi:Domain of unknown function (DUF4159)
MRSWIGAIRFRRLIFPALILLALVVISARAQFRNRGFGRSYGYDNPESEREQDLMQKALNPNFSQDVFTFARLHFDVSDIGSSFGGRRNWEDDGPEADWNLTFRLYQVTSLKIRPGLNAVDVTAKDLEKYPFVYVASGGRVAFSDEEVTDVRHYLLNGGFMMVDDFWGDDQWQHFYEQIKRVFPDREPIELSINDPIFHSVFPFKREPQIPSVGSFFQTGQSYDPYWPYILKDHSPHYYGIYDDKHRMVMIICHNNHYGDGWEHESQDESYFDRFSEPMGYPMFINIVYYAMTH